jgi:5-formyltetrahydrofolate cyclo-ligase
MTEHDIPIDAIVMPEKMLILQRRYQKPRGIYWKLLPEEKLAAIPVLKETRP